jgi:retinol dehydrogenase 12
LAKRGGTIYIACPEDFLGNSVEEVKHFSGSENVFFLDLNLASISSIKNFSKKFRDLETKLDVLINNAGIMGCPKSSTEDGFEMHFGVNYLGHFLLTHLLLDMLHKGAPSRVINVSSSGHAFCDIKRDDLMSKKSYNSFFAYCHSKTAIILSSRELARRLMGTGVTVNSCHPRASKNTGIGQNMNKLFAKIALPILGWLVKNPHEAAQTQIYLAVDPELENVTGKYFCDCSEKSPSRAASDDETARWLFQESLCLVELNN